MKDIESKINMRGEGESIFKIVGAVIHRKICYLLLTKKNTIFFVRPSKLCLRIIVLNFFSFLKLGYS